MGLPTRKNAGLSCAGLAIGALVVSLGLASCASSPGVTGSSAKARALRPVLAAVTATTTAQSYAFDYTTTFDPGPSGAASGSANTNPTATSGNGVVDLDPFIMSTTNSPDSSFPGVTAVVNDSQVWEFGAGDYGTARGAPVGGNPLSGFAQSVEGSLGAGQGALAMISLANPTGRLTLDPSMLASAEGLGTGTVDGFAVTNYKVSLDLFRILDQSTFSSEQRITITQALAVLRQSGYQGTTELISIDGPGYIRQTHSVARFADGGSMTSTSTLSDIGCAGTVLPGQRVIVPSPPSCVSPDQPGRTGPTTTAASPSSSTTTTTATTPSTTTTAPAGSTVLLAADGVATVYFGQSEASSISGLDEILGSPVKGPTDMAGNCDIDGAEQWSTLTAYFEKGSFVGYGTWATDGEALPPGNFETAEGLHLGDTITRAAQLYGSSFQTSLAQGGSWSVSTSLGKLIGNLSAEPNEPGPPPTILNIAAGSVGCPAATP